MNKHDIVGLMKQVTPTVATVDFMGKELHIAPYLEINQRAAFVHGLVEACMDNEKYAFGVFSYLFRLSLIEYYTDIDLGENKTDVENHMLEKLVYGTDLIHMIVENVHDDVNELRADCMAALKQRLEMEQDPLNVFLTKVELWLNEFLQGMGDVDVQAIAELAKEMNGIDKDDLAVAVEKLVLKKTDDVDG